MVSVFQKCTKVDLNLKRRGEEVFAFSLKKKKKKIKQMDECLVVRLEITRNVETKRAPVLISKGTFHPENERTKIRICNFISQNSLMGPIRSRLLLH